MDLVLQLFKFRKQIGTRMYYNGKGPIFTDSGPKNHSGYGFWDQSKKNIGYLDPLGNACWTPWRSQHLEDCEWRVAAAIADSCMYAHRTWASKAFPHHYLGV